MFGFSWAEILLTSAVTLIAVKPKDLPKVMFQIGRVVRRAQYMKFAMSQQFEEFLKEHDLHDMHTHVNFEAKALKDLGPPTDELMADREYFKPSPPVVLPDAGHAIKEEGENI